MDKFRALEREYFDFKWEMDPVAASAAGLSDYDGRFGNFTDDALKRQVHALREFATRIENAEAVTVNDGIDQQALLGEILSSIHSYETEKPHQTSPDLWVEHIVGGIDALARMKRLENLPARLKGLSAILNEARQTISAPVKLFAETAQEANQGGIELLQTIGKQHPELQAPIREAVAELTKFDKDLKGWVVRGSDRFAIGEESFNYYLKTTHGLSDSPQELMQFGRQLKKQVETELKVMAVHIGGTRDWPALADKLRTSHPKVDDLVGVYRKEMERARDFVEERDLVGMLDVPLNVVPTPSYMVATTPFAAYNPPALFSPKKEGTFYVTVPNKSLPAEKQDQLLHDHCIYEVPITALHEGYPGHHLQYLHAQALSSRTRNLVGTPLLAEGWALYCEAMMGQEHFYQEPGELFFQKIHILWRACRVMLDVGLHVNGVSVKDGTTFLTNTMHISQENASAEVTRYASQPTQPMSYAVGMREILDLRRDYQQKAGSDFTLRAFHDNLLSYGSFPVSLARKGMGL